MLERICSRTNVLRKRQLSIEELRCFFGLLLLFGVLKKRDVEISELWNSTSLQFVPEAKAAMNRNWFFEIS